VPGNAFVGFQGSGAVVLRDRRDTLRAEILSVSEIAETLSDDPLAIYKPPGANRAYLDVYPSRALDAGIGQGSSRDRNQHACQPMPDFEMEALDNNR
jgi:hypothetical protein